MIPNVDKYGHCVLCHTNLIIERVADMKVINMFSPDYDQTEFLLDDGTRMKVCICKPCKKNIDLKDVGVQEKVMEAVINGWNLEVKGMVADQKRPDWTEEKGKQYMDTYRVKKILYHSDGMSSHAIEDVKSRIQKKEELIGSHK